MSARLLQKHLAAEGTGFSEVLRETRARLACGYLKGGKSAEEITCMLGFSDPAVFRKAFHKWTGKTPGEFKKEAGGL